MARQFVPYERWILCFPRYFSLAARSETRLACSEREIFRWNHSWRQMRILIRQVAFLRGRRYLESLFNCTARNIRHKSRICSRTFGATTFRPQPIFPGTSRLQLWKQFFREHVEMLYRRATSRFFHLLNAESSVEMQREAQNIHYSLNTRAQIHTHILLCRQTHRLRAPSMKDVTIRDRHRLAHPVINFGFVRGTQPYFLDGEKARLILAI